MVGGSRVGGEGARAQGEIRGESEKGGAEVPPVPDASEYGERKPRVARRPYAPT